MQWVRWVITFPAKLELSLAVIIMLVLLLTWKQ
jgi:hypothetical protein